MPELREIDYSRLLPPADAVRSSFDETALAELVDSIREIGQREPIHVEPKGSRFLIHAGHRRYVACGALELPKMLCLVYKEGECDGDAIQLAENAFREAVNPVDEARKFQRVLERLCGNDVDRLCSHFKVNRSYVDSRLLLLSGDERVLQAVQDSAITLGAAHELNKVADAGRRLVFLDAAIRSGATVRTVRAWRIEAEPLDGLAPPELPAPGTPPQPIESIEAFRMVCLCCDQSDHLHDFELVYVHKTCRRLMLDNYLNQLKAHMAGAVVGS